MPTERELRAACASEVQADVVIETSRRLGCWPDDVAISPERPVDRSVIAVMGVAKGRPKTVTVSIEGVTQLHR